MSEQTIEQELCAALNTKQKPKEHRQDYIHRLVKGAGNLSDEDWNRLREIPTQTWVNKNRELLNDERAKGKKDMDINLTDFPDLDDGLDIPDNFRRKKEDKPAKPAKGQKKDKEEKDDKPAKPAKGQKKDKEEKDDKPAKPAKGQKKDKEEKDDTKQKSGRPRVGSGGGTYTMIRELMISDPKMTSAELVENLAKKGLNPSKLAVSTVRQHTMSTMQALLALPLDEIKKLKKIMGE